eukprot:12420622-Karenia_brevis.AAC.1
MKEFCAGFMDGFPDFDAYLNHMRRNFSWGDHLILQAAANFLLRPIIAITDSEDEASAVMEVNPPDMTSADVWGEPIHLVKYGEIHYEGTVAARGTDIE